MSANGDDPDELCEAFQEWQDAMPDGEFDDYWFGKDGAFIEPTAGGVPYSLRHVHLVPIVDAEARARWDRAWQRNSRRTSDRILIYTQAPSGDFLLIFILPEGAAHDVISSRAANDIALMRSFAETARVFREEGLIVV